MIHQTGLASICLLWPLLYIMGWDSLRMSVFEASEPRDIYHSISILQSPLPNLISQLHKNLNCPNLSLKRSNLLVCKLLTHRDLEWTSFRTPPKVSDEIRWNDLFSIFRRKKKWKFEVKTKNVIAWKSPRTFSLGSGKNISVSRLATYMDWKLKINGSYYNIICTILFIFFKKLKKVYSFWTRKLYS